MTEQAVKIQDGIIYLYGREVARITAPEGTYRDKFIELLREAKIVRV